MVENAAQALRHRRRTAKAALLGLLLPGLALFSRAAPASAASPSSRLNINIDMHGFTLVTDLTAQPGSVTGDVNLSWTEPSKNAVTLPSFYDLRVSSMSQLSTTAELSAAAPLSALSGSPVPAPGPGGGLAGLVITGLSPGVTYYFALRELDSGLPQLQGAWVRSVARGRNVNNFAVAKFFPAAPRPITDLSAALTAVPGQAGLSWTAPRNDNQVRVSTYTLKMSTVSVAALGGDTTAWFNLAASTTFVIAPVQPPGSRETFFINGLPLGGTFYFAIKSADVAGEPSPIDARAAGVIDQARILAANVIGVTASSGPASGSVRLSWTGPFSAGLPPPLSYAVKISSVANMNDDAAFDAAAPLSTLSASQPPAPGAAGAPVDFVITGLTPTIRYFLAVKLVSGAGPFTSWLRNAAFNLNVNNSAVATFIANPPDAVTDLAASSGAGEGEVALSWTAPRNQNFVPISSYTVHFATFSAASLGGDATAWFNLTASSAVVFFPAKSPGAPETFTVGGLFPLSTFYFSVKAVDAFGEVSPIDARAAAAQPFANPKNLPPATPAGFSASAGVNKVFLSWKDVPRAPSELDFASFKLYRSTSQASNFALAFSSTSLSFIDKPLKPFVTYYYKISAIDLGGNESVLSSTASAAPFTLTPLVPFVLKSSATPDGVTISWSSTTRFADGDLFDSTGTPSGDELVGYQVSRATDPCIPMTLVSTLPISGTSHADATGGRHYYYQVKAFNSIGASTNAITIDTLGLQYFPADDCYSRTVLTAEQTSVLRSSGNAYGQNILLAAERHSEDTGGKTLQSVKFRALADGKAEIPGFHFPKPVTVQLHFVTAAGNPVPQIASYSTERAAPQTFSVQDADSVKNLGVFWHNGVEFKKLYGTVDALTQTVSVQTPNVGTYQLRAQFRDQAGATFDISNISAKVITPNGDGLNDVVIFLFDNPNNAGITGRIYDMRGAYVADMVPGPRPNSLQWDGKMNGKAVTSGVYVYQVQGDGKTFNGTIVVAR